jgi:hypothetical protein
LEGKKTLFDLKIDPKFNYHYLIAVCTKDSGDLRKAILYMKYTPIEFKNDDVINVSDALITSKNKLWETTLKDSLSIFNCTELINTISSFFYSCRANNCQIYHFSSEYKIDDPEKFFDNLVTRANENDEGYELLKSAEIRYGRKG